MNLASDGSPSADEVRDAEFIRPDLPWRGAVGASNQLDQSTRAVRAMKAARSKFDWRVLMICREQVRLANSDVFPPGAGHMARGPGRGGRAYPDATGGAATG